MAQDATRTGARKIGLIGGLALRAGIFYYDQIARRFAARGKRLDLVLNHADVGTVLGFVAAGDRAGLGTYLGTLANDLSDAGAEVVAVTAVAPHLAVREMAAVARASVVSVLDAIPAGLEAAGIERVAVFGNRAVMDTDVFRTVPEHRVVRLEPSMVDEVHATYNDIALNGKRGTGPEAEVLDRVARFAIDEGGAQAVLLAGTDLSSFYADRKPAFPHVDVAQLHVDHIIAQALG